MQRRFEVTTLAPTPAPGEPEPAWTLTLPEPLRGAELVPAGAAVLAHEGARLAAIDAASGVVAWQVECEGASATGSLDVGSVGATVVVSIRHAEPDVVCGLALRDGRREWCRQGTLLRDSVTPFSVVLARYDDDRDDRVAAVDVGTGRPLWQRSRADRSAVSDRWVTYLSLSGPRVGSAGVATKEPCRTRSPSESRRDPCRMCGTQRAEIVAPDRRRRHRPDLTSCRSRPRPPRLRRSRPRPRCGR